jgi:hypothetical protein
VRLFVLNPEIEDRDEVRWVIFFLFFTITKYKAFVSILQEFDMI